MKSISTPHAAGEILIKPSQIVTTLGSKSRQQRQYATACCEMYLAWLTSIL